MMANDPDPDNDEGEATMNEMIINAIKVRRPIWNMSDNFYKDCIHKKKLWVEIAYELEMDEDFVRKRWKNLRDKYLKTLKKSKTSSGQAAVTQPPWAYKESMAFLSGVVEPRRTTTNMTGVPASARTALIADLSSHTPSGPSSSSASQEPSRCNISKLQEHSTKSDCGIKRKSPQNMQNSKRRNVDGDPVEAAILSLVHDRQNVPAKKQDLTSEEHFYLSVANDVKNYDARLRMRMRQAVLTAYVEIFLDENAPQS